MTTTATPATPAEWTAQDAHTFAAQLPADARRHLADALRDLARHDAPGAIPWHVGRVLEEDLPRVAGIIFYAKAYELGHALDAHATVLYTDGGDPARIYFNCDDELFNRYGRTGATAGLAYVPGTGQIRYAQANAGVDLPLWIADQDRTNRP